MKKLYLVTLYFLLFAISSVSPALCQDEPFTQKSAQDIIMRIALCNLSLCEKSTPKKPEVPQFDTVTMEKKESEIPQTNAAIEKTEILQLDTTIMKEIPENGIPINFDSCFFFGSHILVIGAIGAIAFCPESNSAKEITEKFLIGSMVVAGIAYLKIIFFSHLL